MNSIAGQLSSASVKPDSGWTPILQCASTEVFEMMAGVKLRPLPQTTGAQHGAITAMVGLAGALCGMMNIRCSHTVAQKLAGSMLNNAGPVTPAMLRDALGELCNMVAGNFKAKIANLADHCMLSVPTVITGEDYSFEAIDPYSLVRCDFDYEGDSLFVTLVVHN